MKYYDENGKEVIIPDDVLNNEVGFGVCATVYKYIEDLCFKRYDRGMNDIEYFLDTATFRTLRNISNPNLVNIEMLLYKDKNYKYTADAYLLSYYEEKYKSFLEIPTDYLLYNMEKIFKLACEMSKYRLRICDLKRENIILTANNIVLIDPDRWWYDYIANNSNEVEQLLVNNIMGDFGEIIQKDLKENYIDFLVDNNLFSYVISSKLFPLTNNKDRAMKVLYKRLNGYKRPIDYVYSLKKK